MAALKKITEDIRKTTNVYTRSRAAFFSLLRRAEDKV
jgi:hypothetical protein